MRALIPAPAEAVDPHEHYAADWLDGGGLRVNFIESIDGAVSVTGLSKELQTPGDNRVFAALRDLADVVLIGSGTAIAEQYKPVPRKPERLAKRREFGLAKALPVAVISRTLRLDPTSPLFADAPEDATTVVVTCTSAGSDAIARVSEVADVLICGDEDIDFAVARRALTERCGPRILCEGGPTIFGTLVAAQVATELCLTLSPMLVGPGPGRIMSGEPWLGDPVSARLGSLLEEDDALFARYILTY
jgi:riboflavin biosynthesis pyrimidine reductase